MLDHPAMERVGCVRKFRRDTKEGAANDFWPVGHLFEFGESLTQILCGCGMCEIVPKRSIALFQVRQHEGILVIHDWGSALGFNRAFRHQDQVAAIAYMEAVVRPFTWEDFGPAGEIFRALRSSAGEHIVLDQNIFVENVLPQGVIRPLSEDEMATYRAPYAEREARLPTLIWPRQASVDGEPEDVTSIVRAYSEWLSQSQIPKLFIAAEPGAVITAGSANRRFCETLKNQQEVTVKGRHFVQEDSPDEIGAALRKFVIETRSGAKSQG
jgi:haloalkane dehalogenase